MLHHTCIGVFARLIEALLSLALLTGVCALAGDVPGLVLHLPLDGALEAAAGKELGATKAVGTPRFVDGRFGQAVSLADGAHLIAPLPPALGKCEFSISLWVKPLWHASDNLPHPILEIPADPAKTDGIGWAPAQFLVSKGWSETIAPNNFYGAVDGGIALRHLKPGQWTHLLIVYSLSGKYSATYFDGEGHRAPAGEKMTGPAVHKNELYIGARATGQGFGDIVVDDLRIYDRAVAEEEIPAIAGATFPPPLDYLSLGTACDPAKAVATPHTAWAKPLAGGPLRVLCVSEAIRAREFIELAQRLDLTPIVLTTPVHEPGILANPKLFTQLGQKIEAALAGGNVDCVLVGAFAWNLVPAGTREAVLAYVRNGGGLLFVDPRCLAEGPIPPGIIQWFSGKMWIGWANTPEGKVIEALVGRLDRADEDFVAQAVPWQAVPAFAPQLANRPVASVFRGGRVEKGRILLYCISCGAGSSPLCLTPSVGMHDPVDYDYALGVAARAVLWTAGRDPAIRIRSVSYTNFRHRDAFSTTQIGGEPGEWQVELWNGRDAKTGAKLTLSTRSRGPAAPEVETKSVTLAPGLNRVVIKQPLTQFGTVFGDARLLLDGNVADWATGVVAVKPGNPSVRHLAKDRESYLPGEIPRITARVALVKYDVQAGKTGDLRWALYDAFGRIVQRGQEPVVFDPHDSFLTEASWLLPPLAGTSLCYTLSVDMVYAGKVTDQREVAIPCRRETIDDFAFFAWAGGSNPIEALATRVLRDRYGLDCAGMSCSHQVVDDSLRLPLEWLARNNLRPWLYATHIGSYAKPGEVRKPDGADPQYLANLRQRMADLARIAEPYSPLFYGLGDETKMGPPDALASGAEQDAFRLHLMQRYKKIEDLNQAWGTTFKNWTDIAIPPPAELAKGGRVVSQVQPFREGLYAGIMGAGTDGVRSVAPQARVGVEGAFGLSLAYMGQDFWKMTRNSTFVGLYDSSILSGSSAMQRDIVRSFLKPGDLLGVWWNYEKLNPEYNRYGPWHCLLRGTYAFGYFTNYCASEYTMLNPDFTPFEQFQWTYEELAPLLAGVGKLVMGLSRDDYGVAVLFNQLDLDRSTPMFHAAILLTTMLDDLGIQHDFIHGDQVMAGELLARRTKVLVLPGQVHMETPVANAIRAFVAAGGALVADVCPAGHDGVKKRDSSPLADLFADASGFQGKLPPQSAEEATAARQSRRKKTDSGETLIFGTHPTTYNRDRMTQTGPFMRQFLGDFLAARGVSPAATVRAANGSFHPISVVTYHDADALYVGMQREYAVPDPTPRDFAVAGSPKAHVYDVLKGEYLGETDRATVTLEVARGRLLAFLPGKVAAVRIQGLPETCQPGDQLTLGLMLETAGSPSRGGVYRVETRSPNGERVAPLCAKVRAIGGRAELACAIAFNDPLGKWQIQVTDVATGVRTEQTFNVTARR